VEKSGRGVKGGHLSSKNFTTRENALMCLGGKKGMGGKSRGETLGE